MKISTKLALMLGICVSCTISATTVSMVALAGLTSTPIPNKTFTLACASNGGRPLGTVTTDSAGKFSFEPGKCTALVGNPTSKSLVGVLCGAGPQGTQLAGTTIKENGKLFCYKMGGPTQLKPNAG